MKNSRIYDPDPMNAPCIICSECGGECYDRGVMYTWAKRRQGQWVDTLVCSSCLEELFDELPIDEKARLVGSRRIVVGGEDNPILRFK